MIPVNSQTVSMTEVSMTEPHKPAEEAWQLVERKPRQRSAKTKAMALLDTTTTPKVKDAPTKGSSPVKTKRSRLNSPPEPNKNPTLVAPERPVRQARTKASTPLHDGRCCSCKPHSHCQTKRCTCKKNKLLCTHCDCIECHNRLFTFLTPTPSETTKKAPLFGIPRDIKGNKITNTKPPAIPEAKPAKKSPKQAPPSAPAAGAAISTPRATNRTPVNLPDGDQPMASTEERQAEPPTPLPETPADQANHPPDNSDLPGYIITEMDRKLDEIYGDHIHQNPGTHLDGGVADDAIWQSYWQQLVEYPPSFYDTPNGSIGKQIVVKFAELVEGISKRKWNGERLIVFAQVILQRKQDINRARDIRRHISHKLELWNKGEFQLLFEMTLRELQANLSKSQSTTTPEQRAKTFHNKVLRGNLRSAVRYITEREKGSILYPDDRDEKSGKPVKEALADKHPSSRRADPTKLPAYNSTPHLVPNVITEDTVTEVANNLSGGAGLGGVDSILLKHLLLRHGGASRKLRLAVAEFTEWMANDSPPWAATRALMSGRLVALDKCPGIRPIGIGELWRRLISKCFLKVAGQEAKEACGTDQLCAGLEAGVEGAVHAMTAIWRSMEEEESIGVVLVDARNAFNELNREVMLWVIRHEWPQGARFVFNCYRHWAILLVRGTDGTGFFLYSQEGATQGDPLAMVAYGVGILPLIRTLKSNHPTLHQSWYADDASAIGTLEQIGAYFRELTEIGPSYGYFPEPSKSILIVRPHSENQARDYLQSESFNFELKTGDRYLGGFVGETSSREEWLKEKISDWTLGIQELASVASWYPQTAYAGLQKSLQAEWQYLQRVTGNVSEMFAPLEAAIKNKFFPALFGEPVWEDGDHRRPLAALPVKSAGLAIPDPTVTANDNYMTSSLVCGHLVQAIRTDSEVTFSSVDHKSTRSSTIAEIRKRKTEEEKGILEDICSKLDPDTARTIKRGALCGQWLSVLPSTVNGTELSPQEFRDNLLLRYARSPGDLPERCDGCDKLFTVQHALDCKSGGLIIQRHNEIQAELVEWCSKALTPSAVRVEPLIHLDSDPAPKEDPKETTTDKSNHSKDHSANDGKRGDVLARGLFQRGSDCIIDVRVTDLDCKTYRNVDPDNALKKQEKEKKSKYLQHCLKQRRSFVPFVVSTDGMLGYEANNLIRRIAKRLAEKWDLPYSQICGMVRARVSIATARATHLCIRGSRVPASKISHRVQWDDGAGVGLFKIDY